MFFKKGADLVYVFCYKDASNAIQCLAPDIIVISLLPLSEYEQRQKFIHFTKIPGSIVIGPGLGRDLSILKDFSFILENFANKIIICDADFFWFLQQDIHLFKKALKLAKKVIFTPNILEFGRLYKLILEKEFDVEILRDFMNKNSSSESDFQEIDVFSHLPDFKKFYDFFDNPNLIIFLKFRFDFIISSDLCFLVKTPGSKKRCGGLGDILTGILAQITQLSDSMDDNIIYGVVMSSYILKKASFLAFQKHKISLIATDVLLEVALVVNSFYVDDKQIDKNEFFDID